MLRIYCDACGKEIERKDVLKEVVFGREHIQIRCMILFDQTYNAGQVCLLCIQSIVASGKIAAET